MGGSGEARFAKYPGDSMRPIMTPRPAPLFHGGADNGRRWDAARGKSDSFGSRRLPALPSVRRLFRKLQELSEDAG